MRIALRIAAVAPVVLCLAVSATTQLDAQVPAGLSNPKVVVYSINGDGGYRPVGDQKYAGIRDQMIKLRVLEKYSQFLSPLHLPYTLRLYASDTKGANDDDDCNQVGSPHYSSETRWINMCYQFSDLLIGAADAVTSSLKANKLPGFPQESREQIMLGLYAAVLMHETGHAMFDLLRIPVFGREEDAADQMAAFVALNLNKDMARTIITGFAYFWLALGNPPTKPPDPDSPNAPKSDRAKCFSDPVCAYADEHGTSWQRMYNVLCLAYGSDHAAFQDLVTAGWLPKDRVASCDDEYKQLSFAFQKTVLPFVDLDMVNKVKNVKWISPDDLK